VETVKTGEKIMTNSTQKNGYMKWKDFMGAFLGMMVIIISLWSFNVSSGEFSQFEKRIDDRFNSLIIVLQEIKSELRDLRK